MTEGRLRGVRVLVTRPRERARELCFLLEDEGAEVISLPLLELLPPEDPRPLRAAAEHVGRFGWVAFASPSAVQAFTDAVREAGTWDALRRAKIAVVGPRTAQAVRELGLTVQVEPEVTRGAALAAALSRVVAAEEEILLPAAAGGRPEMLEALRGDGFRVTHVVAYRSVPAEVDPTVAEGLLRAPPGVALFGSPRTVEAFLEMTGDAGLSALRGARRVAIGPTTAEALQQLGLSAHAVAERPTAEGLVEAAVLAVRG